MAWLEWTGFCLAGLMWGSSFLWIKVGLREVGPLTLVAFRISFGVIGLLFFLKLSKKSLPTSKKIWFKLFTASLLSPAVPFFLITWAETRIDSGMASILNATVPLFTIMLAHFILADEKITRATLIGLAMGFVGVFVLLGHDLTPSHLKAGVLGQLAVLVASAMYAGSAIFVRKKLSGVPPIVQVTGVMLCAAVFAWVAAFAFEKPLPFPTRALTWASFAWLGFLGTSLAFFIYFSLIKSWGATRTSVVNYIFPVIGLILGILFLGESPHWQLLLGSALIFSGVLIVNYQKLKFLKNFVRGISKFKFS